MPDSFADTSYAERLSFLTHKRGRGRLYDLSEADAASYVDRNCVISDESSVWRSKLTGSLVRGSTVSDAVVERSSLLFTQVHGATVRGSVIAGEFIGQNAVVESSELHGKTRVSNAYCRNIRVRDLTIIGPGTRVCDWPDEIVDGAHGYITRGIWPRPPRIFRVSATITVTEGVRGYAFVHCREFPISHWLKIGHRYGRAANWTTDEVRAVRKVMHLLANP